MRAFLGLSALLATGLIGLGPAMGQMVAPQPYSATFQQPAAATPPTAATPAATTSTAGMTAPSTTPASPKAQGRPTVTYTSVNVDAPYIALTFDDGPNPATTPKLLKMLEARHIKATFFVLGNRAVENKELLKRMADSGHEIGNHSWSHPQLSKVAVATADKQIADTSAVIEQAIGKAPIYLRPPYGDMTPTLRHHLEDKYGLTLIYWSVDPLDWKNRNADSIYNKIMAQVRPGAIVLAHDIHATTVDAMPKVLDELLAKGYKFVTVSELIAMNKPSAPKTTVASLSPPAPRPAAPKKEKAAAPKPATTAAATTAQPKPKPAASRTAAHTIGLF